MNDSYNDSPTNRPFHLAVHLTHLLHSPPTSKDLPNRPPKPLTRHTHPTPIPIANPSHKDGISRGDFLLRRRRRIVSTILSADFGGGDFAAAFGGLLFEEAVYGVHL